MKQTLTGSVNFTKLKEAIERGEVSTWTNKSGELNVNTVMFLNDEADQYGNTVRLKAQPKDKELDTNVWLGNFKPIEKKPQ